MAKHTFDETKSINIEDIVIKKDKKTSKNIPSNEVSIKYDKVSKLDDVSSLKDIVKNDYQEKTITTLDIPDSNKIGIACDHRGYKMKQKLTKYLTKKGYTVVDYGGDGIKGDDYTYFGFKLGKAISNNEVCFGIAVCGSGIGISIACNKVKNVRCAKVNNTKEVKWARRDNDANVIAISASMPLFRAKDLIDVFLKEKFSGLERHQKRIDDLNNYAA